MRILVPLQTHKVNALVYGKQIKCTYQNIQECDTKTLVNLFQSKSRFHTRIQMPDQVGGSTVVLITDIIMLLHQCFHAAVRNYRPGIAVIREIALRQGIQKYGDTHGVSDMCIPERIRQLMLSCKRRITYQKQNRDIGRNIGECLCGVVECPGFRDIVEKNDSVGIAVHVNC